MPPDRSDRHHVVVLSPHLDDAVLSLGALIARLTDQGRRVEVVTAFTRQPDLAAFPRAWRAFGDYTTRRAEDDEALGLLGARGRHLDLPERIWREPRPRTVAGAFRGPATSAGFACLDALTGVVADLLARPDVEVYAPLGVGQHADHLEVAVAALLAAGAAGALDRVAFYEDFYALAEPFRRQHPVTRRAPVPRHRSPGLAAPAFEATLLVLARLASDRRRSPRLDQYVPSARSMSWRWEARDVTGYEPAKLAAVAQYGSQVSRLGGQRRLEAVLRRAHRTRGGEILWRVNNRSPSTG